MTWIAAVQPDAQGSPSSLPLRFYLFGEFTVRLEGEPLPAPPYRVQGVLAALLLHPQLWAREQLAGRLFPDVTERQGRKRLSHRLWQIRQWLPELPVEATPQTLEFPPQSRWLDVEAFIQATGGDDLERWLKALALYRGDLLAGVYDDWLLEEREALYLRYIDLAQRACDALWQQGRFEELLPVAERLVQREPLDERTLRTLMRAYQALGRRGAALASYERYVSLALDEMGIEPEPATQALAQAIQTAPYATGETALSGVDADTAPRLLHQARKALIRGEMERVRAAIEKLHRRNDTPTGDLHLLEIDLALFVEDYERAATLLAHERSQDSPSPARVQLRSAKLALGLRDAIAAERLAAEVLMAAREIKEPEMELEALLVLIDAHQQLGQGTYAARNAERALNLARENGLHYGIARVLILRGTSQLYQGRYERARSCLHEAHAVALEHGLRYDLAAALRGLRVLCTYTNVLSEALKIAREELSLWRDLGLERWEAVTLEGVALIQNYLGRSEESLRRIAQAYKVSQRLGDPVRIAINRYNFASSMLYHDDGRASGAVHVARQALSCFRDHKESNWEAATLTILGYALWVDGQHAAALNRFRQAHALSERLGELAFVPELLAYQGLAYLGLERPDKALALTRQAMISMAQGDVSNEVIPEICYAHAMALVANGCEEQAQDYFRRAYEYLLESAAALQDEEARQAFFHRNPTMRRLMGELRARDIAPPQDQDVQSVNLPAVRGGDPLRVRWTVDAGPADAALKRAQGAIALRRARLTRLLEEAQTQGAAPSTADLARALGVSQRTIQRDRAALRRET
ncbi:MAG: BTAD domain-containing putative transcriptional regulator [Anaerolineae bacterium]